MPLRGQRTAPCIQKFTGRRVAVEVRPETEHCEETIQADILVQNQDADSDLGTSLDSAIDTSSILDNNQPVLSWSPEDCFGNEAGPEPQDFGNVLSQLGIGVPSNFWDMDRTTFTDLPEIDPSFVNISGDPTDIPQLLENGALNGQTTFSDYTSPSSGATWSLTNGKISGIETSTRRVGNSDSLLSSEPLAIYIRKNKTAGHYVGELFEDPTSPS